MRPRRILNYGSGTGSNLGSPPTILQIISKAPIKPFLEIVVQASPVLGIGAFVASIFFNSLVFDTWGLSFLQIASASDVVLSGIVAFAFLLGILLGCFLTFVSQGFANAIANNLPEWCPLALRTTAYWLSYLGFFLLVLFVGAGDSVRWELSATLSCIWNRELLLTGVFVSSAYLMSETIIQEHRARVKAGFFIWLLAIFSWVGAALFIFGMLFDQFDTISKWGYGSRYSYEMKEGADCLNSTIMWLGSDAVVIRCGKSKLFYQVYFNKDDLHLISHGSVTLYTIGGVEEDESTSDISENASQSAELYGDASS